LTKTIEENAVDLATFGRTWFLITIPELQAQFGKLRSQFPNGSMYFTQSEKLNSAEGKRMRNLPEE
jgi:hypothetical protein